MDINNLEEVSRDNLGFALNTIKSNYNENKQTIIGIEKSIKNADKLISFYNNKKADCNNQLKYMKEKDIMGYFQFGLFAASVVFAFLSSAFIVPLILGGISIIDSIGMIRRNKLRKLISYEIKRVGSQYDIAINSKKGLEEYLEYYKKQDKILSKKIDILTDILFSGERKDTFRCDEVFSKLDKVNCEEENIETKEVKKVDNYVL